MQGKEAGYLLWKVWALDDLVDERAQAAPLGLEPRQDRFDHVAIGELDARAGGVSEQILRQVARHLILAFQEQLLELVDVLKLSSVGQLARASTFGPRWYSQILRPRNFPGGESPFSAR